MFVQIEKLENTDYTLTQQQTLMQHFHFSKKKVDYLRLTIDLELQKACFIYLFPVLNLKYV